MRQRPAFVCNPNPLETDHTPARFSARSILGHLKQLVAQAEQWMVANARRLADFSRPKAGRALQALCSPTSGSIPSTRNAWPGPSRSGNGGRQLWGCVQKSQAQCKSFLPGFCLKLLLHCRQPKTAGFERQGTLRSPFDPPSSHKFEETLFGAK